MERVVCKPSLLRQYPTSGFFFLHGKEFSLNFGMAVAKSSNFDGRGRLEIKRNAVFDARLTVIV